MQKSKWLNTNHKAREHIIELVLVILAIILTGVYLNMGIRISRSEIMIIPIVGNSHYPPRPPQPTNHHLVFEN